MFDKPASLPPPWPQNHAIPLIERSNLVRVRPYRHRQGQKNQIEIMVEKMLAEGKI